MTDSNIVSASGSPPLALPRPTSSLVYFAFGSNLSSTQMRQRCPGAKGMSLGRLRNYSFLINTRGYANVVPHPPATDPSSSSLSSVASITPSHDVYGVLWQLDSAAEKAFLDLAEGVAFECYQDQLLLVEILDREERVVGAVWALCYVDPWRTTVGSPHEEYIGRMNLGIEEARVEWGLPDTYVRDVIRTHIPEVQRTGDGEGEKEEAEF